MIISLIVAVSENNVIGRDGDLPWRLSADLRRFKGITMGHAMIMGRKTFESIGRPLPGRTSIVVTRQKDYDANGCLVAHSLNQAFELASDDEEVFVIGGSSVFESALPLANRLYWTSVHAAVEGDIHFPQVNWDEWRKIKDERHTADAKNEFDYSFYVFERETTSRE